MTETGNAHNRAASIMSDVVGEVARDRLVSMLVSSEARTVCLAAPSGYGKTTVARQWAARDERTVLEVVRPGPVVDAAAMAEAVMVQLQSLGMVPADVALPPASDSLTWHLKVLPALGSVLSGLGGPVLLILDDTTDLRGTAWEALVDCLVHHVPPRSTVCIVTRTEVPRSFRQQRMHGTELEIRADRLAFDLVETELLYRGMGVTLTERDVHDLWDRTEGWPAVLYLSGLALREGGSVPSSVPTSTEMIRDFMRDNILGSLEPDVAEFAMKCSLLEQIDGQVAVAVTGRRDAESLLRDLSRSFTLIRPLDAPQTRFGMHSLLRTFLCEEFHATSYETWRDTHVAAGDALAAAGNLDAAVGHAVIADARERLRTLVWPLAVDLLTSGRTPVLRRWLDVAGPQLISAIPELAVSAAWAEQHEGDLTSMARYAALAERTCKEQACEHLDTHLGLLRASMAVHGVADMERTSESLVAAVDPADPAFPTVLYHLGVARVLLGRPEDGLDHLDASRRMAEVLGQHVIHAIAASDLGVARLQMGDSRAGVDALDEARHVLQHHQMDTALVAVIPYAASAYGYALEGQAHAARDHLGVALRLVSRLRGPAPWFALRATLQIAGAALAAGDVARARDLLGTAEREYGPANACPANDQLVDRLQQAMRDIDVLGSAPDTLTMAEMRILQYLPTHLSFPDIAGELYLSRFTVKTQALAVYRKLGVHSRYEAVEKAREIGLIPPA